MTTEREAAVLHHLEGRDVAREREADDAIESDAREGVAIADELPSSSTANVQKHVSQLYS